MKDKTIKINLLYNFMYQVLAIAVPIIITPYTSRVLGAEGVGKYAYACSIAYYFAIFIKLGLNNYGNRTIAMAAKNKRELSRCFWNIYATQITIGVFCIFAYVLYLLRTARGDRVTYLFIIYVFSYAVDITWFFWGMEEFRLTVLRDALIKMISTACILGFVKESTDVWKYTLILTSSLLISQLSLWPSLLKRVFIVRPSWLEIKKHIRPNLILFIPTIAVSIYKIMDKVMLGAVSGEVEVGYYESCEKILNLPMAITNALGTVMLPHMAGLYSEVGNRLVERAGDLIRRSEQLAVLSSSLLCFGIMSVAEEFVPLFYGQGFEKCIILYKVLLPSCIFLAVANVIKTQLLIPKKQDKEFIISLCAGVLMNLITNLLLIPKLASVGAAIGTLLAEAAVCIMQVCIAGKQIPILRYLKKCMPYILIGVVMFLASDHIQIKCGKGWIALAVKVLLCGMVWVGSGVVMLGIHWIKRLIQ